MIGQSNYRSLLVMYVIINFFKHILPFLQELFDNATEEVTGPVRFTHQWVNVSDVTVMFNGSEVSTCRPSMGFSFAAGIPDGPGIPPFTNGKHSIIYIGSMLSDLH